MFFIKIPIICFILEIFFAYFSWSGLGFLLLLSAVGLWEGEGWLDLQVNELHALLDTRLQLVEGVLVWICMLLLFTNVPLVT